LCSGEATAAATEAGVEAETAEGGVLELEIGGLYFISCISARETAP